MLGQQGRRLVELFQWLSLNIDDQEHQVGPADEVEELRFHIVGMQRRRVHQLYLHVVDQHHPRCRRPGREGEGATSGSAFVSGHQADFPTLGGPTGTRPASLALHVEG